MSIKIVGVGSHLPETILTNKQISSFVETTDEWIQQNLGIRERRVSGDFEFSSDLAVVSSINAINDAGLNVNDIDFKEIKDVDLLIAGFPCQDLSIAKRDGKGLEGARSGLFSKCLEALEICKPKYFLFENVNSMKKEWKDKISKLLGVEPIMINSALLTAQMRKRLYWTNIPNIQQPEDKGIVLKDIIESGDTERLKSYCIPATYYKENVKSLLKRKKEGL